MSILDRVDALVNEPGVACDWTSKPLPSPHPRFDIGLFRERRGRGDREGPGRALRALEGCALISDTKVVAGGNIYARLSDDALTAAGAGLERGEPGRLDDLAAGRRFAVHFCDPNATKALHVGHLRNIALGHALSCALRAAGAEVEVRSVVADFGRNMAEALAATWRVRERLLRGEIPGGGKADHFVGSGYRSYVEGGRPPSAGPTKPELTPRVDTPMAREMEVKGDLADELLARLLAGEPEVVGLARVVSELVVEAQNQTLGRLGITADTTLREADLITHARTVATIGTRAGLLERDEEGSVIYTARQPGSPVLQLIRHDGTPTQHLRSIAYWLNSEAELRETSTVRFCGEEWQLHAACSRELRARLLGRAPEEVNPTRYVFHSMVAMNGETVKLERGEPLLIDDLLDWLDERMPDSTHGSAASVALGYFLPKPPTATIDFSPAKVLSSEGSLGWLLARARDHVNARARPTKASDRRADDPAYRFAVLQGESLRAQTRRLVSDHDSSPLGRHLYALASWYLKQEHGPAVSAVVGTTLEQGARVLGLERAPSKPL